MCDLETPHTARLGSLLPREGEGEGQGTSEEE